MHLYKIELDKACFADDAVYSDSKDLAKIVILDKIVKERAYKIAIIFNMMYTKRISKYGI